ncbi:cytochrome b [Nocardioides sediminis]|uniref:cytochrome b n=1 Tax=Nocardioides sediminis TaxID=433648 RepID=UPI000D325BDA|nr:cytochrome b/b6 domain-containing protein [Nocardioides sediminis]
MRATEPSYVEPATGYGRVAKVLHWATVLALLAQLTVGYLMEAGDSGRGRGRGRSGGSGRGRGRGGDDEGYDVAERLAAWPEDLVAWHVVLGVTVLLLAVARVAWRRGHGLPPWAATLSSTERRVAHWAERALLTLLFAIPLTGLSLLVAGDDVVALHVASHVAFFAALTAHLGLVLKHQLVDRDRLLRRML